MDESVFIIVALVIVLGLVAGLYLVIDLLSQRVLELACEARRREQREIVNHERLARTLNELVDEVTILAEALKKERILRSNAGAADRAATKSSSPPVGTAPEAGAADVRAALDDRGTMKGPPALEERAGMAAIDDDATCVLERENIPFRAPPLEPC